MKEMIKEYCRLENKVFALKSKIEKELEPLYFRYDKDFGCSPHWNDFDEFEIHDDILTLYFEVHHCGCCPPDTESVDIPIEFFDDYESAKKKKLAQIAQAKIASKEKDKAEKALNKKLIEARERQQLQKLKEKYD